MYNRYIYQSPRGKDIKEPCGRLGSSSVERLLNTQAVLGSIPNLGIIVFFFDPVPPVLCALFFCRSARSAQPSAVVSFFVTDC